MVQVSARLENHIPKEQGRAETAVVCHRDGTALQTPARADAESRRHWGPRRLLN